MTLKFRLIKKSNQKVAEANLNDPGKKSYDILPGVGEIVLWAAKDKRGYLIDINGSWYLYPKIFFTKVVRIIKNEIIQIGLKLMVNVGLGIIWLFCIIHIKKHQWHTGII